MRKTPRKNEGRDWGDVTTSQGMPKVASKLSEARGESTEQILTPSEGTSPADSLTLGSDLQNWR